MKKYKVIYADPPWAYRAWSQKGKGRSAESHYSTMSLDDIKALPVGELADKDVYKRQIPDDTNSKKILVFSFDFSS